MEILWGERADGVFTFKSNYSNLFRGREKQSSSRREIPVPCSPGREMCVIMNPRRAGALLNPDPCISMASFPTGTSIPRPGVEMNLAPLALQSPVAAISIWHAEG